MDKRTGKKKKAEKTVVKDSSPNVFNPASAPLPSKKKAGTR